MTITSMQIRIPEDDRNSLKDLAEQDKSSMSAILVELVRPYIERKKALPRKTTGREVNTTCTLEYDIQTQLRALAEEHGLSVNEALQFMIYAYLNYGDAHLDYQEGYARTPRNAP